MHAPGSISLGHFLMQNAAACGHPLDAARAQATGIAEAVRVVNAACQHISDGLDAAVRVPGKACRVVFRDVVTKIVHHQEGVCQ